MEIIYSLIILIKLVYGYENPCHELTEFLCKSVVYFLLISHKKLLGKQKACPWKKKIAYERRDFRL